MYFCIITATKIDRDQLILNNKTDCHDITEILLKEALNTKPRGIKIGHSLSPVGGTIPPKEGIRYMVFNVTFNNFSVISWRSVLLVEETGVAG